VLVRLYGFHRRPIQKCTGGRRSRRLSTHGCKFVTYYSFKGQLKPDCECIAVCKANSPAPTVYSNLRRGCEIHLILNLAPALFLSLNGIHTVVSPGLALGYYWASGAGLLCPCCSSAEVHACTAFGSPSWTTSTTYIHLLAVSLTSLKKPQKTRLQSSVYACIVVALRPSDQKQFGIK
jgi:hypothetical protein